MPIHAGLRWIHADSCRKSQKMIFLNCFHSKKFFTPAFHLLFHKSNCFQFKILIFYRKIVNTHTNFDVCVLTICNENPIFWKDIFRQKIVTKKFLASQIFFQILEYKNFLILKMNIFLDFSFLKKQ